MTLGDVLLPGERPWTLRWEAIRRAVDFRGTNVLELGCNMGLLSSFAMLEGATSAHGVDRDAPILEASRLTASALGVTPTFEQVDLANDLEWEERLAGRDVVVAMSVIHWLPNPGRVLSFLGTHPIAIYEGHDDLTTEIARLRQAGFSHVTSLLESERGRHVLLARKL
jgi:SAM-dependent methyltransferase